MCCKNNNDEMCKDTTDHSREASIHKAIAIYTGNQNNKKRQIIRPDINPVKGILKIIIAIILYVFLIGVFNYYNVSYMFLNLLFLFIVLIKSKTILIWLILLYQKYAPERIRKACVFEPTCSNYMIMSINKYGFIRGTIKGLKRLFRCHPPNGGIDNP